MLDTTSLLELLHPDGSCRHTLLAGSGCPSRLGSSGSSQDGELDLAVVAPDACEARGPRWIEGTVPPAAARLARDGLLCALVAPKHRRRLVRLLGSCGLETASAFLYHERHTGEDDLIPLEGAAIQHALRRMPSGYTRAGRLKARLLSRPSAGSVLRGWHPRVFIVGRYPGARPLFEWFLQSIPAQSPPFTALIHAKWRRNRASVVLRALNTGGQLAGMAKLTLGELDVGSRVSQEADFLRHASKDLRDIGLSIPDARVLRGGLRVPAIVETVVPGDPAAVLLLTRRICSSVLLAMLGERLLAWSRKTTVRRTIESGWLERVVLGPAESIVPRLEHGERYLAWLRTLCHALTGVRIPLVATHGDLTMWNVLVTPAGSLGVVDWEAGAPEGLPLRDLCYAALDINFAAHRYRNRVDAFINCFESAGPQRRQISHLRTKLGQALGLSRSASLLCFHACWLQHAAEEAGKRNTLEARPFRDIVSRLALQPDSFETGGLTE